MELMVNNSLKTQQRMGTKVDLIELFLLTKQVGNFQLSLKYHKSGHQLNYDQDLDQI